MDKELFDKGLEKRKITVFCGVPVGVECHRIANRILSELEAKP